MWEEIRLPQQYRIHRHHRLVPVTRNSRKGRFRWKAGGRLWGEKSLQVTRKGRSCLISWNKFQSRLIRKSWSWGNRTLQGTKYQLQAQWLAHTIWTTQDNPLLAVIRQLMCPQLPHARKVKGLSLDWTRVWWLQNKFTRPVETPYRQIWTNL